MRGDDLPGNEFDICVYLLLSMLNVLVVIYLVLSMLNVSSWC
jgi:hypothetical protein